MSQRHYTSSDGFGDNQHHDQPRPAPSDNNSHYSDRDRDHRRRDGDERPGGDRREELRQPEELPPSFLYCVKQIQMKPYEALRTKGMLKALALRHGSAAHPRPHVLQRHLVEFFAQVNGRFGVNIPNPYELVPSLIVEAQAKQQQRREREAGGAAADDLQQRAPRQPAAEPQPQPAVATGDDQQPRLIKIIPRSSTAAPMPLSAPPGGAAPAYSPPTADGLKQQPQQQLVQPTGETNEEDMRAYRNRQIRQMQRSTMQPKTCLHYGSKEGCRRGIACPFHHQGWDGSAATANGVGAHVPQGAAELFRMQHGR